MTAAVRIRKASQRFATSLGWLDSAHSFSFGAHYDAKNTGHGQLIVLYPGLAQRMSAGRGITHSEMNGSADDSVWFLQMWVVPDAKGIDPSYEERDVNAVLDAGGLVAVASGQGHDVRLSEAGPCVVIAHDPTELVAWTVGDR